MDNHNLQDNNVARLYERVAILENQSLQINHLLHKLELTIDKLADVSSSLKELIAVHDHRLTQIEERSTKIHDRNDETAKEADERLSELNDVVLEIREDVLQHIAEENQRNVRLNEVLATLQANDNDSKKRIEALERWRWFIVGGIVVAAFVIKLLVS